eukprot:CAMPEP_0185756574 /NCGR_PEP_ID=MMETSP1174-20130828/14997_1 /TAXON_ID=35687 /ORGANISM="Dictyocha speculum, Strain CCMP1381" /LENGTH=471 /DNA_ID=CAMNT_0028435593 /DNA_START=185 /DNA_END=1600 /DNA_ORIENTATION=+
MVVSYGIVLNSQPTLSLTSGSAACLFRSGSKVVPLISLSRSKATRTAAPTASIEEERRRKSPGLQNNFYDTPNDDFKQPYGGDAAQAPPAAATRASDDIAVLPNGSAKGYGAESMPDPRGVSQARRALWTASDSRSGRDSIEEESRRKSPGFGGNFDVTSTDNQRTWNTARAPPAAPPDPIESELPGNFDVTSTDFQRTWNTARAPPAAPPDPIESEWQDLQELTEIERQELQGSIEYDRQELPSGFGGGFSFTLLPMVAQVKRLLGLTGDPATSLEEFEPNSYYAGLAAAGLGANYIVFLSLYNVAATGAFLPSGPYGLVVGVEGVSVVVVSTIIGITVVRNYDTGYGLPSGPFGLLRLAEKVSFFSLYGALVVFPLRELGVVGDPATAMIDVAEFVHSFQIIVNAFGVAFVTFAKAIADALSASYSAGLSALTEEGLASTSAGLSGLTEEGLASASTGLSTLAEGPGSP